MLERLSENSNSRHQISDSSARSGRILHNPPVQRKLYGIDESRTGHRNNAFNPQHAQAQLLAKYTRHRNRAVWAQALVLFNVVGIPLSHDVYLEYYYTTALSGSSLSALSIIPAIQMFAILSMPGLAGWVYQWRRWRRWRVGWKIMFFVAAALAVCAQLPLQWTKSYMLTMILQGPLLGAALGALFTLSTLVLSSHYQFNLPLVSMQSGFMGLLGALIYAFIARQGFGPHGLYEPVATAGILAGTLAIAFLLLHHVKDDDMQSLTQTPELDMKLPKILGKIMKEKGTMWFILGYILVFYGLFTFPMFIIVALTPSPALFTPDLGSIVLLTCLGTAAISACISANPIIRSRLGPVNTMAAACIFAGAASIIPAFMPYIWITIVVAGAYGIGLGAILALHVKTMTVFQVKMAVWHPDMPARAAIMLPFGGVSAFAGLYFTAVLLENMESGTKVAFEIVAGCLAGGGVLIAVARWRKCRKFGVAI